MSDKRVTKAIRSSIARADLGAVYAVRIDGRANLVTGNRAYCERERAKAIRAGRGAGPVDLLERLLFGDTDV